jgi:hypothetical protein
LFSGSKQTATDRRARLGNERFEELEIMKFAWKQNLADLAAWNSEDVEEINILEFEEILVEDKEADQWDIEVGREDLGEDLDMDQY